MDLISVVANEKDNNKTLRLIRVSVSERLRKVQGQIEHIQPSQGAQVAGQLFEMLVMAEHRTKDARLLKKANKALHLLADAVAPLLDKEDTPVDPYDVQKLYSTLAGAEFTIAARHAVERRQQEMQRASASDDGLDPTHTE